MRKILIILTLICTLAVPTASAQYVRVNIDTKTIAAMSGAFGTESVAETYYKSQIKDILFYKLHKSNYLKYKDIIFNTIKKN